MWYIIETNNLLRYKCNNKYNVLLVATVNLKHFHNQYRQWEWYYTGEFLIIFMCPIELI